MREKTLPIILAATLLGAAPARADLQSYCTDVGAEAGAMRLSGAAILTPGAAAGLSAADRAEAVRAATAACLARFAPEPEPALAAPVRSSAAAAVPDIKIGSTEWKAYCAKKYVSFDAATGTYTTKSGKHRPCQVTRN